jgi:hypothetical protein
MDVTLVKKEVWLWYAKSGSVVGREDRPQRLRRPEADREKGATDEGSRVSA